jgi:polyhydroxyalkanoate synthesis repressor PhaR
MPDKPRRRRIVGPPATPGERLIRKYGNRRLYDTHESRYVTLEDLVDVFASEEPVRVVDAVTGEDLTKRVLAQAILFEESRRRTQIIPIELLRALLRHRDQRESIEKKLQRALGDLEPHAPSPEPQQPVGELAELKRRLKALESQIRPSRPAARRR